MFAKSNLNDVACTYSGEDACTPESAECCAQNDAVYKYLLANTPPGTIAWNFDKILDSTSPSAGFIHNIINGQCRFYKGSSLSLLWHPEHPPQAAKRSLHSTA